MSNTFTKTGARVRGFTLIELLVVIAIIGLLSTIIAAPIQSARKKARDAKKIAELKSTELALEQYAESNSAQYPVSLSALSPQFMPLLPLYAASTTSTARDAFAYVFYTASSTGSDDQIFSYHFGIKLEVYGPALETDRDCVSATLSNALTIPYCAVYNGDYMNATFLNNGTQISATGSVFTMIGMSYPDARDFSQLPDPTPQSGQSPYTEEASSTCVGTIECIFDVTSQQ